MPKDLANQLHINTLLVMLPYDMDKVEALEGVKFKVDKAKQIYSFLDARGQRQHYKLVADSDAAIPTSAAEHDARMANPEYSRSHDAAAFVKVTPEGTPILDENRKPRVTVTFPGMNNPGATDVASGDFYQGVNDALQRSSYDNKFFDAFISQNLNPALEKLRLKHSEVDVVAHSMGNKNAFEFASRYGNDRVMSIDGWDEKDALVGAALRQVLRSNAGNPLNEKQFAAEMKNNLDFLTKNVVEINKDGSEEAHTDKVFTVKGAAHRAASYISKAVGDLLPSGAKADKAGMLEYALDSRHSFFQIFDRKNGTEVAEAFFLEQVRTEMFSDGKLSKEEQVLLGDLQKKLGAAGLQIKDMQEGFSAAATLQAKYNDPARGMKR
jgi:pimeloyl-ACP methyl ester carboxylesterase